MIKGTIDIQCKLSWPGKTLQGRCYDMCDTCKKAMLIFNWLNSNNIKYNQTLKILTKISGPYGNFYQTILEVEGHDPDELWNNFKGDINDNSG